MQVFEAIPPGDDPQDDLVSQATLWVVRLTSGGTTEEERLAFQRWRDESPAHAAALDDARRLWLNLGPAIELVQHRDAPARKGRRALATVLAASITFIMAIGGYYLDSRNHDYVTGAGERRMVVLADGTHVVLNTRTALDVNFKNNMRKVRLVRGEAYFDVVHDVARPFTVAAGAGEVRDIGTAFSVRRNGDGASVLVTRGSVEVQPVAPGVSPAILGADQEATYAGAGPAEVRVGNASVELSWMHGQLILEDRTLTDSAREINRYYRGRLVLLDDDTGARRINAAIDINRIDDWLTALEKTHTASMTRIGSLVLLY